MDNLDWRGRPRRTKLEMSAEVLERKALVAKCLPWNRWLNLEEAAAYVNCTERKILDAMRTGALAAPPRVRGGTVRVKTSDLDFWIENECPADVIDKVDERGCIRNILNVVEADVNDNADVALIKGEVRKWMQFMRGSGWGLKEEVKPGWRIVEVMGGWILRKKTEDDDEPLTMDNEPSQAVLFYELIDAEMALNWIVDKENEENKT